MSFLWILFAKQEDKLCNPGANIPLVQHKGSYLLSAAVVFIGNVVRYTQMGKKTIIRVLHQNVQSKHNKNQEILKTDLLKVFLQFIDSL